MHSQQRPRIHLNFEKLQTKMLDSFQRVPKSVSKFHSIQFQGFRMIDSGHRSKSRLTFQVRPRIIFPIFEKLQNKKFDSFQRVPRPGISTALKHNSETKCIRTAQDGRLDLNYKLSYDCNIFEVGKPTLTPYSSIQDQNFDIEFDMDSCSFY